MARLITGVGVGVVTATATAHLHELHVTSRPQAGVRRLHCAVALGVATQFTSDTTPVLWFAGVLLVLISLVAHVRAPARAG